MRQQDKREADRIKAVVALATGWTAEEVAEILQVDANTVRNHFKRYRVDGLAGLNRVFMTRVIIYRRGAILYCKLERSYAC